MRLDRGLRQFMADQMARTPRPKSRTGLNQVTALTPSPTRVQRPPLPFVHWPQSGYIHRLSPKVCTGAGG